MTYQKIKTAVVDEQKRISSKQLIKLTINLALAFIGICLALSLATYAILGFSFTIVVILCTILAYNWIFDLFVEDEKAGKFISTFAKFWWINYLLVIAVFFVLKFFRFL